MAQSVPFPGFAYDDGKADTMADAILATLAQLPAGSTTLIDRLAALGIAAALTLARAEPSWPKRVLAITVGTFASAVLDAIQTAASRTPRPPTPG